MISLGVGTQVVGLVLEIIGTFFFAENVFLSDEDIKEASFHEVGGYLENVRIAMIKNRDNARKGLAILLIGLGLQAFGLFV